VFGFRRTVRQTGVLLRGVLLNSAMARAAWSFAIGIARVAFHDIAVRAGVFGDRSPWQIIHQVEAPYQYFWLLVALAINTATYFGLMVLAAALTRRWTPSLRSPEVG
jgi:hypothetical protein